MEPLKAKYPVERLTRLVDAHLRLQLGCYFTETLDFVGGKLSTSHWIEDHYWNSYSAFPIGGLPEVISEVELEMKRRTRRPAFYFDPSNHTLENMKVLLSKGYQFEREVWMSAAQASVAESPQEIQIRPVQPNEIPDFLKIFSKAFGGPATKSDGYGDIPPEYLKALEESLARPSESMPRHVHLLAVCDGCAVGCGSIHIGEEFGGLYNVGVLPEWRCNGIGGMISRNAIKRARETGIHEVFFQTQPGGSVQRFYEGLGCEVIFEAEIAFSEE